MTTHLVPFSEITAAADRIGRHVRRTPVLAQESLSALFGFDLVLKAEHLQRTGSFKVRGALNRLHDLGPGTGVVAASAGNHAQGVAYAAGVYELRATIFMPAAAPLPKIAATRGYGADVRLVDGGVEACMDAASATATETGAVYVHPFDDPLVIAGQGTAGLEITEEIEDIDAVLVPIGGGGLIAGVAVALRERSPATQIIGVEAQRAPAMRASLRAGRVTEIDARPTIADGIALKAPSERTFAHAHALVDDVVEVTEEEIAESVLLLLERAKAVVEPSGAASVAALLAGRIPSDLDRVVAITSGGNVDPLVLAKLIEFGLVAAHRFLVIRVVVSDRPGALAAVAREVADLGLNITSVEHHRIGDDLALNTVEIVLYVETRGASDRELILDRLGAAGFDASVV